MGARTISFPKGKGHLRHNNRNFVSKNVDRDRLHLNRYYIQEPLKEAYEKCFGRALKEYNEEQTRPDRKKGDYITEIKNSKNGEKVFYENVVQIGDRKDTGIAAGSLAQPEDVRLAVEVLEEYVKTFQARNPNLYLFNAVLHMDEATPHLHLDYIPVAHGYSRGMKTRNSLTKALQQQGIQKAVSKTKNETVFWQERERAFITSLCRERGLEICEKGEKRDNLTLPQYKAVMAEVDRLEKKNIDLRAEQTKISAENEKSKKDLENVQHKIEAGQEKIRVQKEKSRDLGIRILAKEEVRALPEPQTTFSGDVKISKERYQSILATAGQVSVMKKTLQKREAALERKEKEIENRQKLPVKDQMELAKLRRFRDSVIRVFKDLKEDNPVKRLLRKVMEEAGLAKTEAGKGIRMPAER